MGTQVSFIRNYGYTMEPRTQIAIDNPGKVYAYSDSGIIFRERRDLLNKIVPYDELIKVINELKSKNYGR